MSVQAKMALHESYDYSKPFPSQVGLAYVRGCEVEGMLDSEGKVIEEGKTANQTNKQAWCLLVIHEQSKYYDNTPHKYVYVLVSVAGPEPKPELKGDSRTFRVWLDTNQYQKDMEDVVRGGEVSVG